MATSLLSFGKIKDQESEPVQNTSRLAVTPEVDQQPRSSNGINIILMVREHGQQQILETMEEINSLEERLAFARRKLQCLQDLVQTATNYEPK